MTTLCTGKRPALDDARDLLARDYLDTDAVLRKLLERFGHGLDFHGDEWGMLGNDGASDCCFAGGGHEEMIFGHILQGVTPPFTRESVLSDYSALTGYVEGDPSTDQGTFVREFMGYRQNIGLVDGSGTRHRIGPYVSIDPKNWDLLMACVYEFGVVGIGFEFPASAWEQFDDAQPWDVVAGSPLEGGHYVPVVGTMHSDSEATCVTWARRQVLTRAFYERYNDEAWAYVPGAPRADGTGLHHVDIATLNRDLAALKAV